MTPKAVSTYGKHPAAEASLYVADEPDGALRHLEAQQARKDGNLACVLLGPWRGLADDDDADVSPATKRRRRSTH